MQYGELFQPPSLFSRLNRVCALIGLNAGESTTMVQRAVRVEMHA